MDIANSSVHSKKDDPMFNEDEAHFQRLNIPAFISCSAQDGSLGVCGHEAIHLTYLYNLNWPHV